MAPTNEEEQNLNASEVAQSFSVFGLSHKTAPLAIREKLAWTDTEMDQVYERLNDHPEIRGATILSTCNRVEVYTVAEDPQRVQAYLREEFLNRLDENPPHNCFYGYAGVSAVEHLARVTSGLDSMILGEPQIAGQVKEAYSRAVRLGMTDSLLNQLSHRVFRIAKKVRTDTDIQRQPVSVPYTAVLLAEQIFGDLSSKRVLLIGAGEMSELAAQHLVERDVEALLVANRSLDKAQELSSRFIENVPCEVLSLESIDERLHDADIIIASTSAQESLVHVEHVKEAMRKRKNRAMFFIDLGVPRDIDSQVNDLMNVYLFDIDDLQQVVDGNLEERQKAAQEAHQIIRDELRDVVAYLAERDASPVIRQLIEHFEGLRQSEMEKLARRVPDLSAEERQAVDQYSEGMIKKLLHPTLEWLKDQSDGVTVQDKIEQIRRQFRLK